MIRKDFTKEQILFIKNNKGKPNVWICEQLNISPEKQTLKSIKHLKPLLTGINEDYIEFVRENKDNLSYSEMDNRYKVKSGTAKLVSEIYEIKVFKQRTSSWTKEEMDLLDEYYTSHGPKFLAGKIDRNVRAIISMASSLGYKRDNKYSEEEEKDIIDNYLKNVSKHEIAKKYGRSPHAIESLLSRKSITMKGHKCSKYHVTEPELYVIKYLSEKLGISLPDKTLEENRDYYYHVLGRYEIDVPIYLGGYKFAIEYDGAYWHKDKEKDARKNEALKNHGYIVFRISSSDHGQDFYNLNKMDYKLNEIVNNIKIITGSL